MRFMLAAFAASLVFASCAHAQTQSAAPPPPPPPNCSAAEHHALDFWIGEWDAFRADNNRLSGRSSITASDGGCVINEHWTSLGQPFAYSGRSLNTFNTSGGHWEEYWADSTGSRVYFVGGVIAARAVQMSTPTPSPTGPNGAMQWQRVTFTPNADATVTQQGDTSPDGQTWTLNYRLIYRHHQGN
jgi:hypothetical protein